MLHENKQHQEKGSQKTSSNITPCSHENNWSPLPTAAIKFNVDGHIHGDGRWGLGWVVRKTDESCLRAATRIIRARLTIEAEARGLESALCWLDIYKDKEVTIEMDASIVVQAVREKKNPRAYWG
jgi:ribonuclease HI